VNPPLISFVSSSLNSSGNPSDSTERSLAKSSGKQRGNLAESPITRFCILLLAERISRNRQRRAFTHEYLSSRSDSDRTSVRRPNRRRHMFSERKQLGIQLLNRRAKCCSAANRNCRSKIDCEAIWTCGATVGHNLRLKHRNATRYLRIIVNTLHLGTSPMTLYIMISIIR